MRYGLPHDSKGPRFRKPVRTILNSEFYKKFKKDLPGLSVSSEDIKNIINTFHSLCIDVIATTRDGLELYNGLGYIIVGSYKSAPGINYHPGGINYQNWETDKRSCKIYYTNVPSKYKFKFHDLWGFCPGRPMKKKVSESFKEKHTDYYIVDANKKIAKLFKAKDRLTIKLKRYHKRLENGQTELRDVDIPS